MIQYTDILSIEYLKKTEFTGCHKGMRYRLESAMGEDGEKRLRCTVWPEPFNFFKTPEDQKESELFSFDDKGIRDAVAWMNDKHLQEREKWEHASENWSIYE